MNTFSVRLLLATITLTLAATGAVQTVSARMITSDCGPSYVRCASGYQPLCNNDGRWQCIADGSSSSSSSNCGPNNVRCMDGYNPQCDDGRWQCIANSSSTSSANDCGANPLLCAYGMMPECSNGFWHCVLSSSSSSQETSCSNVTPIYCFQGAPICHDGAWHCPSTVDPLEISRLSPASGKPGTRVIISGQSFTRRGNIVHFDNSTISNTHVRQKGTKLVFTVPAQTTLPCLPFCKIAVLPYGPGIYDVSVENKDGAISNALTFTITGSSSSSSLASCSCPAGQAWNESTGTCGGEQLMCPMYMVLGGWCGCDGKVYSNSCFAAAAGVKEGQNCIQK